MSKTKKSRKQDESSDESEDSSTSEDSSSDSSSEDRSRKHKKKSRKVKKRKSKKKSIQSDDIEYQDKDELKALKRSKKAEKHKKKRKHQDSDSDVQIEEHEKVLYVSSGAECDDDKQKHHQRDKRLSELKMLRGSNAHSNERNFQSKWDSPADEREKIKAGNYASRRHSKDRYISHEDIANSNPERFNRRHESDVEYRRFGRRDDEERPGNRQVDIGKRYDNEPRRQESRRFSSDFVDRQDSNSNRDQRLDNFRQRDKGRDRIDFNNRPFNDRQGSGRRPFAMEVQPRDDDRRIRSSGRDGNEYHQHRSFDDRRRDERMEGDGSGRRDVARVSRNPFDRKPIYRVDEPKREERVWANEHRYPDKNADRFPLKREHSGGNRFNDNRRRRPSSSDRKSFERDPYNVSENQRIDKRDGRRDHERDGGRDRRDSPERKHPRTSSRSPVLRRHRRDSVEDSGNKEWGKKSLSSKDIAKPPVEKEKPNFGLSGKLTEDTNKVNGVVINYAEPPEARKPKRRWRLYPFKGEQSLQTFYIHRQSCFLIGRDRKICDIPVDHPSCSKQHAVLQYRLVPYTKDDGTTSKRVRPYLLDMNSANGTFVNNKKIDPKKYMELLEKDVIKFGFSSREYVLLHENSKDEDLDDDIGNDDGHVKVEGANG